MKHLMLFLMMLATVAAVAAETDGWRDLSGQTDRSAGFVLADGEFPSGANGWRNIDGRAVRVAANAGVNGALLRTHRPGQLYAGQPFAAAEGGQYLPFRRNRPHRSDQRRLRRDRRRTL